MDTIEGKIENSQKLVNITINEKDIPKVANDLIKDYDNRAVYFETSRGCMFNCSYCLSSIDKKTINFDIKRVEEELKILLDKNVMQIRFVDRTFNSDKNRALHIWKYILKNRKDTKCHFEINARILDGEMFEFLETIPKDIFHFEIGVQSTNIDTLIEINRGNFYKIEVENIKRLISMQNIQVHIDLIAGLPYETYEIFKKSFNDVYSLNANELQLGFLKLLHGTKIRNDMEKHGYVCTSYPPYEVISNSYISYEEISKLKDIEHVLGIYYNLGKFKYSIKYMQTKFCKANKNCFDMYEYIASYFKTRGYTNRNIAMTDLYKILIDIYDECIKEDNYILREILKLDFTLHFSGKKDWMEEHTETFKNNIGEYINLSSKFMNIPKEDIMKKYKFEEFSIDILKVNDIILKEIDERYRIYNDKIIVCFEK